ncbi:MAG TPA: FAD-binding and (Fe-S)-binding domain-containing protein [Nocardioides sp.]|nr:FAD-binding and (Fe-S)-binding domain-containing protein [Nocardioides sp.]
MSTAVEPVALAEALDAVVPGGVHFDAGHRAAYSTDASNYRQVPIGVVVPRTVEEAVAAVRVCHEHGVPLLSRGGGTSLAGQCTNTAVVIDWSVHCRSVLEVDAERRTCVVEPGIVLDDLNRELAPTGLRFGPEPATHRNCTIGGMIGNNSCGATAQRTGKVVDNVRRLEVLLADGTRFWCGPTTDEELAHIEARGDLRASVYRRLRDLAQEYADDVRHAFPHIPRRVSGYNLDSLLPEYGFDVARALVGSESTLVTILHAELELVPVLPESSLVVLGFDSIDAAADAVPSVLTHEPEALEGLDEHLLRDEKLQHEHLDAMAHLPAGRAYLVVQLSGESRDEVDKRAQRLHDDVDRWPHPPSTRVVSDPGEQAKIWTVREAGLGATAHPPGHRETHEGWEDSAVPVEALGDYLRDLRRLFEKFGYEDDAGPALYGHFGQGCVHTRIPFELTTTRGVAAFRSFLEAAADLVVRYGGSLSGEHGDGQTRGELLERMYPPRVVRAFQELKAIFDPRDLMNPGKVVHPRPLDHDLRWGPGWTPRQERRTWFAFPDDHGSFADAADRCVGVGRCRQSAPQDQVMCPSYQVTRDERHSTRGRSRLLFEMLDGHREGPIADGWRSEEVREALDLCLACKGCKHDCPVGVDMATYKAEFLAHHYAGRLRPRADYTLGWLPAGVRMARRAGLVGTANALFANPLTRRLGAAAAGLENRPFPPIAPQSLQEWASDRPARRTSGRNVLLWPDTFTNQFAPEIGQDAVRVLEDAGFSVEIPTEPLCCGLTWISTGQLRTARRKLTRATAVVADHLHRGGLVVGLEPSCTAVLRSDGPELLPENRDVRRLRDQTLTLAELLTRHAPDWHPELVGRAAAAQVHCHQHAIMGWDADEDLLASAGVDAERLPSGCCGLAGNFGFTRGHGEISRDIAGQALLPELARRSPDVAVLADGFSCRTQIEQLDGRKPLHLAQLLAQGL